METMNFYADDQCWLISLPLMIERQSVIHLGIE
ncbi:MAG: hypothetical protein GPOALKHO_001001 [Sodalis sp.]|nr:MAG: hypothetical protein GPOALKHO_001001 [Sodalis sp.]